MEFYEACKIMYKAIRRGGHPGIEAAGDAGSCWIISPAPEDPNIVEYGLAPYFVDKKTGVISCFSVTEAEDWERLETATQMVVPKEFAPVYS